MRTRFFVEWLAALATMFCLSACSATNPTLDVRVYTGLVPGPEFSAVETTVFVADASGSLRVADSADARATFGADFARGHKVATFVIPEAEYQVRVRLLRPTGALLVERVVAIRLSGDSVVSVHLTRDCVGVTCPAPGGSPEFSTCLAGRCVDPRCSSAARDFCPDVAFCNEPSDCDTPAACAATGCEEGVCVQAPIRGACDNDEWCNPDVGAGCQSLAGIDSNTGIVCGTICTDVATPCQFGYWECSGGPATCTALQNRPFDYVCADGHVCDVTGACVVGAPTTEVPGFVVSPATGLVTSEAGGSASFSVSLVTAPSASVFIVLVSDDASEGSVSPAFLAFNASNWNVPQSVTVTGIDDLLSDGDVSFSIRTHAATSSDPNYDGVDPADIVATNIDDDAAAVLISRTSGLVTNESGTSATFDVRLATMPVGAVTIPLSVDEATEIRVSPSSLTFTSANYSAPQLVTVTGVDDGVHDGDQLVHVVTGASASLDASYNELDPTDVSVTNIDDENPGFVLSRTSGLLTNEAGSADTFTIRLLARPTAAVTIPFSVDDATEIAVSPPSITFTTANYASPRTVTVTGVDDDIIDGAQTANVIVGIASTSDLNYSGLDPNDVGVTNIDDDAPGFTVSPTSVVVSEGSGGTSDSFAVRLNTPPTAAVTLAVSVDDASEISVVPSSLTFMPADYNVPQVVTVTAIADGVTDRDQFPHVILGTSTSSDSDYNGLDPADVSVRVVDVDFLLFTSTGPAALVTTEAGGTAVYSMTGFHGHPGASFSIALSASDTSEATVSPSVLTFTPGDFNTPHVYTVTGVNDALRDGDVNFTLMLSNTTSTDPALDDLFMDDTPGVNLDDDFAAVNVSPTSGLVTSEVGGTATFNMVLQSPPLADVTVSMGTNATEAEVSPTSVTFTPLNWNTPRVVLISGVDDGVLDGDARSTVVTSATSSTDAFYSGVEVADVLFTNHSALVQQAYVKAAHADADDHYGCATALSADGNTLAVAACYEDSNAIGVGGDSANNGRTDSGAVYIYTRAGPTWSQQAYLKASNPDAGDMFGSSLAISDDGSTLAIGAFAEHSNATGIGGNQNDNSLDAAGATYVFTRSGTAWTQQAYIKASNPSLYLTFSYSVALASNGDTLAVSATGQSGLSSGVNGSQTNVGATYSGAVYVFGRSAGVWSQQAYIKASNPGAQDRFGYTVALSSGGDTLAVAAPIEASAAVGIDGDQSNNSLPEAGAAYVFTRVASVWSQQAYVKASNTGTLDQFGMGLALSSDGNTLAVGAPYEGSDRTGVGAYQLVNAGVFGAVYVYDRVGSVWSQTVYIKPSRTWDTQLFGQVTALSGDGNRLIVASPTFTGGTPGVGISIEPALSATNGVVFVFSRSGGVWQESTYIVASNAGTDDRFGTRAAISRDGTTLVVGAELEDSAATGIGGDQTSDASSDSGAVYLFSLY